MMKCPSCHDEDAYVGLSTIECLNPDCLHFKEMYLEQKLHQAEEGFNAEISRLNLEDELVQILSELWVRENASLAIAIAWRSPE